MIKRTLLALAVMSSIMGLSADPLPAPGSSESTYTYVPPEGYVPDAATAKLIAEAIWIPIYGKKLIDSEKPFKASLKDGIWKVEGSWKFPKDDLGGVAVIKISQKDCRISQCLHGQ
jgi:hypothetical protein